MFAEGVSPKGTGGGASGAFGGIPGAVAVEPPPKNPGGGCIGGTIPPPKDGIEGGCIAG